MQVIPTDALLQKQQQLKLQNMHLRLQLQEQMQSLHQPLRTIEKIQTSVQWLKQHPEWPVLTVLILVALKPRRAIVWSGRIWWMWRAYRQYQRFRFAVQF